MEDYTTEILEVWPDNMQALAIFKKVGTRWRLPPVVVTPVGGASGSLVPIGVQWEALYPLMDRLGLDEDAWNDLHDSLMEMEDAALATMREFAQHPGV